MTNKIEFEIPETCGDCIFYERIEYRCHSEQGLSAICNLGYMKREDMRDKNLANIKYKGCKLHEPNQLFKVREINYSNFENI
jgi:hypothetical protein